jgi:alpha-beta hydrolase superfamily lysophospholipase
MSSSSTLQCPDGEFLALQDYSAASAQPDRGQVILIHGLGEHMGRYATVIQKLNAWGYAVRAYDHYGHGQSSGARGCLPSSLRLLDDLTRVVDDTRARMQAQGHQASKLLLLGHSMGGLVAADFVARRLRPIDGLMLSSPALGTRLNAFEKLLLAVLPRLAPNLAVANGLDARQISHDEAVVAAYLADPLVHNRISPRLGQYIAESGPQVVAQAAHWTVPTLLMFAGQDMLVDPNASRRFTSLAPSHLLKSICFENLRHEIFNEIDPSPVFAALGTWLSDFH